MTVEFSSALSAPHSGRRKAVIIDHLRYTQSVILRGAPIPWDDPVSYANFNSQAQGLLPSDVTLFDAGAVYAYLLDQNEALVSSISARSRTGYALKTLLADVVSAKKAVDLAAVVSQTSKAPFVLQIPSPLSWLAETHRFSGSSEPVDTDDAENLCAYIADWLRAFADLPVTAVLLDGRGLIPGGYEREEITNYSPIINVTENYRWALATRDTDTVTVTGSILDDSSILSGTIIPEGFWTDASQEVPNGAFYLAEIPADAIPETVLSQLKLLT
ncbi:hypothetical protein FXW78_30090 [Rhodococcus opacus]|nr:hypothetical protein [Rhodococcus opacus]RZL80249.1 MAG: hypothetical protein EOP32_17375 [Rhodococcus sp. (in: high G+C Gram-positive bacteria)]